MTRRPAYASERSTCPYAAVHARLGSVTRVFSARVQGGVIVAEGHDLLEGTTVTVATSEPEPADVELDSPEIAALDRAIAEADADTSEPVPNEQVLAELDRIAASR